MVLVGGPGRRTGTRRLIVLVSIIYCILGVKLI